MGAINGILMGVYAVVSVDLNISPNCLQRISANDKSQ